MNAYRQHYIALVTTLLLLIGLAGCSSNYSNKVNSVRVYGSTTDLKGLHNLHSTTSTSKKNEISRVRLTALKETGMTIGAQAGLAWRTKTINKILSDSTKELDNIFNFNAMLMEHNVLPPVLVEAKNTLNLADNDAIRLADRTYKIQNQARFVSTAPSWRDYLWMEFSEPEMPDATLLPQNKQERLAWRQFVDAGWQEGNRQANIIYTENLARLRRDYTGMALYRKLLAQNIVSKPFVARSDLGVTGDEANIRINDQILRITALPALSANSKAWQAILTKDNE